MYDPAVLLHWPCTQGLCRHSLMSGTKSKIKIISRLLLMTLSNRYLIVCEYLVINHDLSYKQVLFKYKYLCSIFAVGCQTFGFAFVFCLFVYAWCPKWVACFDFCLLLHQSKMHTLITQRSGPALFACALEGSRSIRAGSMDARSA